MPIPAEAMILLSPSPNVTFAWKPIQPLSASDRNTDVAAMRPLYESWWASQARLHASSAGQLAEFTQRLVRRLSVETGILERLYDVDRGTTEALVAQGFAENLVSHSSTDIPPASLISILRDQEAAIQLVMDAVAHKRELTKGMLHELHSIITRHQDVTIAVDQFGHKYDIALLKGQFKEQHNNPKRPDGKMHEYCPPIHVDAEVENLLSWLSDYSNEDPIVVAAWLHHRFTQIHPYQDGNGRLARTLAALVLIKAKLLPLVVDRDLRVDYIYSLEQADQNDLAPLIGIFARLERNALLQALSVDADIQISHQKSLSSAVIGSLVDKFGKRRVAKLAGLREVNSRALELRTFCRSLLEQSLYEFGKALEEVGKPDISINDGGPDRNNAHFFRFEVVKSSKEAHKFANFDENHYFIKTSVTVNRERMIFVVSFHHVGRELTGIMEATTFSKLVSYEDSDDRDAPSERFSVCSLEPFVFANTSMVSELKPSFKTWLDASLAVAIKEYGDLL